MSDRDAALRALAKEVGALNDLAVEGSGEIAEWLRAIAKDRDDNRQSGGDRFRVCARLVDRAVALCAVPREPSAVMKRLIERAGVAYTDGDFALQELLTAAYDALGGPIEGTVRVAARSGGTTEDA